MFLVHESSCGITPHVHGTYIFPSVEGAYGEPEAHRGSMAYSRSPSHSAKEARLESIALHPRRQQNIVVKSLWSDDTWVEILVLPLTSFLSPGSFLNHLGFNPLINKMGMIINITESYFEEYIKHCICRESGKW